MKQTIISNYREAITFFAGSNKTIGTYSQNTKFIFIDGKKVTFPFVASKE